MDSVVSAFQKMYRVYEGTSTVLITFPDSKVHGAYMGPIWGRQDPGGPHVGLMNFAIWVSYPIRG